MAETAGEPRLPGGPPRVAGLILAAGRSSRMGRNKLLIEIGGRPLLCRVADMLLASQATPVVMVIGHDAAAIRGAVSGLPVILVDNRDYSDGMATSLKAGVGGLPNDADGVIVCLGDMPGIERELVDRMIAAFDPADGRDIIVPCHGGRRGHPVLLGRRHFHELCALTGDRGARTVIASHPKQVVEIEAADTTIFADIDTPDALAAFEAMIAERDLIAVFCATRYVVLDGDVTAVAVIGRNSTEVDGLLDSRRALTGVFITAWNPRGRAQGAEQNSDAQAELAAAIAATGHVCVPARHRAPDPSWDEESWFVPGFAERDAVDLARAWGQRAIVCVRYGEPARLVMV